MKTLFRKHRLFWIIVIAGFIFALCGLATHGFSSGNTDTSTTQTAAPSSQRTTKPTPSQTTRSQMTAPTATPTQTLVAQEPRLGASPDTFIARYGKPKISNNVLYNFDNGIEVTIAGTDLPKAENISQAAPNDKPFTDQESKAACIGFLPRDAIDMHRHVTRYDSTNTAISEDYVYTSALMAKLFPAMLFEDQNGNPTKPGTIALTYDYMAGSTNSFVSCTVMIGLY